MHERTRRSAPLHVAEALMIAIAVLGLGILLGEDGPGGIERVAEIDSATLSTLHSGLFELRADNLGIGNGTLVRDAELPGAAIIVAIRRHERIVRPRGSSALHSDDHLYRTRG